MKMINNNKPIESPLKSAAKATVAGAALTGTALAGKKIYTTGKDAFVKSMTKQTEFLSGKTPEEMQDAITALGKKIKTATTDGVIIRSEKAITGAGGSLDALGDVLIKGTNGAPAPKFYQNYKKALEQTAEIIEDKKGAIKNLEWQKQVASTGTESKTLAVQDAIESVCAKASDKLKGAVKSVSDYAAGFKKAESKVDYLKNSIKNIDKKQLATKAKPILIGAAVAGAVAFTVKTIANHIAGGKDQV